MSDVRRSGWLVAGATPRTTLCVLVAALGVLALGTNSADAATLVVDKDGQQCKNADYQSISAAVGAAEPSDKIKVCPDLYTESVVVDKPRLKLTAKGGKARDCFEPTAAPADPSRQAIVTAPGDRAFDLQADRITLSGFVVQGSEQGVRTGQAFSGYLVRHNVFQQNDIGATFGGSGERLSRLSHNCFRNNNVCPCGTGVFSAGGLGAELRGGRIDHNSFFQNNFAIRLGGGERTRIDHNRSQLDDVFLRPAFTRGLEVTANHVGEGSGAGITFFFNPAIPHPNVDAIVSHNVIEDRGGHGIGADPNALTDSVILHNRLTGNALDGINLLTGNSGNHLEQNRAEDNGSDGIHAEGATGNVLARNAMFGNVEHDAHDDNRPANRWIQNRCETDFPTGTICAQELDR